MEEPIAEQQPPKQVEVQRHLVGKAKTQKNN